MQDFDWNDDRDIAVREQPALAVYENPNGHIVIRQRDASRDADDQVVICQRSNVPALCRAIYAAAGIEFPIAQAVTPAAPKSSGAQRSRRYRQRHAQRPERHATVTPDVTRHTEERDDEPSGAPLLEAAE